MGGLSKKFLNNKSLVYIYVYPLPAWARASTCTSCRRIKRVEAECSDARTVSYTLVNKYVGQ